MRKTILLFTLFLFISLLFDFNKSAYTWGFFAHKKINRMAVFTLPPEMIGFYKKNIEFITEHAVDPDKRRYAIEGEAQRHYIDLDHYVKKNENIFEVIPKKWEDAVLKFTEDTLQTYGIVPWHIDVMVKKLTYAFKEKNIDRILSLSADIGHYVGDAHVPLHTTKNYNGQYTNQRGIHGFWESRIPELFSEDYDYFVGKAKYISYPLDLAWKAVEQSFNAKDSVLELEKILNEIFPSDQKYSIEDRGKTTMKVYSKEYSLKYNDMLNGMVERRMRETIIAIGSLWYTAWVNAGQPNLNELIGLKPSEEFEKEQAELEKLYQNSKIKGRGCD